MHSTIRPYLKMFWQGTWGLCCLSSPFFRGSRGSSSGSGRLDTPTVMGIRPKRSYFLHYNLLKFFFFKCEQSWVSERITRIHSFPDLDLNPRSGRVHFKQQNRLLCYNMNTLMYSWFRAKFGHYLFTYKDISIIYILYFKFL